MDVTQEMTNMSNQSLPLVPQTASGGCACGTNSGNGSSDGNATPASYVFAIGRIEARFRSLGVEKEFAHATGRAETAGLTDRQALHAVLTDRANRYLAKQLCWVLTIEGLETYILAPSDSADTDLLVESLRAQPRLTDIDVVVGVRGPVANADACNGLMIPYVAFDQVYSFDVDTLIKAIPRREGADEGSFAAASEELFVRISQLTDNAGNTDEHRALNFLAVRYPAMYNTASEMFGRNFSLEGVDVRPSRLSGVRRIVDVIFSFSNRDTDISERYFVRVDVTEEFPFLVSKMQSFYER